MRSLNEQYFLFFWSRENLSFPPGAIYLCLCISVLGSESAIDIDVTLLIIWIRHGSPAFLQNYVKALGSYKNPILPDTEDEEDEFKGLDLTLEGTEPDRHFSHPGFRLLPEQDETGGVQPEDWPRWMRNFRDY